MSKQRRKGEIKHFCNLMGKASKGAISILLMIVTTPFLGLSVFLVESVRYQDVIELMYELQDLSSLSTMGYYDEYLNDRFGLVAVDQTQDLDVLYQDFLEANAGATEVVFGSVDVTGQFPLSDKEVFEEQVLECSEISSIVEILFEGLDLSQLFEKINGKINTDKLDQITETGNTALAVMTSLKDLIYDIRGNSDPQEGETAMDSFETLWNTFYNTDLPNFTSSSETFREKLSAYCSALSTARAAAGPDDDPYADPNVVSAWNELSEAKSDFRGKVEALRTSMSAVTSRINQIAGHLSDLATKLETSDAEDIGSLKNTLEGVITTITNLINSEAVYGLITNGDTTLSTVLSDIDSINNTNFNELSWDDSAIADSFYNNVNTIMQGIDGVWTTLNNAISTVENVMGQDSGSSSISKFLNVFAKVKEITCFYNSALNANINKNDMLVYVDENFSEGQLIEAIGTFCDACQSIVDDITNPDIFILINLVRDSLKFLESLIHFIGFLVGWIVDIAENIADLWERGGGTALGALGACYNSLLVEGYAVYNFSNRTTFKQAAGDRNSAITGYSYNYDGNSSLEQTFGGTWSALGDIASGINVTTDNTRFIGAELEYILCGLGSEIQNQVCTFLDIYLIRLAFDTYAVFTDTFIQSLADSYPPFTLAIYILVLLIEPFLDTFMLVNGVSVPLIKGTCYLTPSGIPKLVSDLNEATQIMAAVCGATDTKVEEMQAAIEEACEGEATAGLEDFAQTSYAEQILLLMLLKVPESTVVQRMQNLVQMECVTNNADFNLNNAYTYINTDVNYTINPLFDVGFTNNGYISVHNNRYSGY